MSLTAEQKQSFDENGYLHYGQVLSLDEVELLRQRCEDIAERRETHLPDPYIQMEPEFRENPDTDVPRLDTIRKMTRLAYHDELFESVARKTEIVDVVEQLLGPNIKLYGDQLMMKPRFHGTVTDWHQDCPAWPFFLPQQAVSAWVALDDATVDNGCMTLIPGSHKWGPISRDYVDDFLAMKEVPDPVSVEVKTGDCMFHNGLTLHRTGANTTANRRRGWAIHYITAETMYLGAQNEDERMYLELGQPKGTFRFMQIRGKEFPGRV